MMALTNLLALDKREYYEIYRKEILALGELIDLL